MYYVVCPSTAYCISLHCFGFLDKKAFREFDISTNFHVENKLNLIVYLNHRKTNLRPTDIEKRMFLSFR